MNISDASNASGLSADTIRFYERSGFAHAGEDVNPTSGRPVLKMAWKPSLRGA